MKYILNESPVKTTKGFNVNNVKVELEVPNTYNFHEYEISNINIELKVEKDFTSNIGLRHDEYKSAIINVDNSNDKISTIRYHFSNDDNLIDNIKINIKKDIESNIFIEYVSDDDNNHFHNGNIVINAKENSNINLTILNNLNSNSINMLSGVINCSDSSNVKINLIDLKGRVRIYNFNSITNKNASSMLNNIYIGKNDELIDLSYQYINKEDNSNNNIEVQGMLDDNAKKTFRGIIDFKTGCKNSIGYENEDCLLLSSTCISKSLPVILCEEEHVTGNHSVSNGKIDSNKLFYLMSRGLDELDAKKLIITSKFNNIINEVPDELKEVIVSKVNEII